jgi:DNA-binding NarL/FixJ family response regulator
MKRITVILAEDHQIVREGFRSLLEHERDIAVVGEAANGRQAVQLTRKLRPDVVIMDIAMPVLNGLEASRQIRKDFPETKVLFLSAHSDDAYVEQVAVLGATGFLLKQTSSENLATAIREVQKGNSFYTQSISKRVQDRARKSVAAELGVSFKTVDKHRQNLMSKLDIHDVSGLTRYAISEGIIESTVRVTIT